MSHKTDHPASVADAIRVDEIGIAFGVHGDYRLRSSYQPVFARRGARLVPTAIEAVMSPYRAGTPVAPTQFVGAVAPGDKPFVQKMCRDLHLRNYRNIGSDGVDIFLDCDPGGEMNLAWWLGEIDRLSRLLDEIDLDPGLLVCEISMAGLDDVALRRLAAELRSMGMRIAVEGVGTGHLTPAGLDAVTPDFVRIEARCFRILCREAATARLMGLLVSGCHERGAQVLVEGVEDAPLLRMALESGADLFRGDWLARPALAGTVFEPKALTISKLLDEQPNVLRLSSDQ